MTHPRVGDDVAADLRIVWGAAVFLAGFLAAMGCWTSYIVSPSWAVAIKSFCAVNMQNMTNEARGCRRSSRACVRTC